MPVFTEDPCQFSKQRLRSELVSHNVKLPSGESKKQVYVELYMKHVGNKSSAEFSSDDEDQIQDGDGEMEQGEEPDMLSISSLTDDQLKGKLLEYGIKAGPILASTRALYEKKLHRLLKDVPDVPQHGVNSIAGTRQYYDSEEEDEEDENEQESGSELSGSEMGFHAETSEPVTDVLMELFPDAPVTPTGIIATKRRPIKGAAGRPVQFKYPETPVTATARARRELCQPLVPLWARIVVFLLLAALLYLIFMSIENPSENPFSALLNGLSQEAVDEEDALTPSAQT